MNDVFVVSTALDPSQPAFEDTDKEVRLDKNDADFVEVIHTNAILGIGYGLLKPHGKFLYVLFCSAYLRIFQNI